MDINVLVDPILDPAFFHVQLSEVLVGDTFARRAVDELVTKATSVLVYIDIPKVELLFTDQRSASRRLTATRAARVIVPQL
jgi:hypothetical protein